MERPDGLPDEAAEALERLDPEELRAASRYAARLASRREVLRGGGEAGPLDAPRARFLEGADGDTYWETGGVWGSVRLEAADEDG